MFCFLTKDKMVANSKRTSGQREEKKGGNKTAGTAVESGPEETEPGPVRVVCTKSRSWTGETAVEEGGGGKGMEWERMGWR